MFRIAVVRSATLCMMLSFAGAALSAQQEEGVKPGITPDGIKPLPRIEVTAPKDVRAVEALNDALDALFLKVGSCVDAGRKRETCQCSYPQELAALRKNYESLMKQHPAWKDQILSYQRVDQQGRNISGTLVMATLRRQLEALKCE